MMKMVRIYDGRVAEVLEPEGVIIPEFHPDMIWVDITDVSPSPIPGWTAIDMDGVWSFAEPIQSIPTDAELKVVAMATRDARLSVANEFTGGMADAYIVGLLSDADVATFKAFAAYKLALNKIDQQPGYPGAIDWPTSP